MDIGDDDCHVPTAKRARGLGGTSTLRPPSSTTSFARSCSSSAPSSSSSRETHTSPPGKNGNTTIRSVTTARPTFLMTVKREKTKRTQLLEQLARLPSHHPDRVHVQSCSFGTGCLHCKFIVLKRRWKWKSTFVVPGTSTCWLKPVIKGCDDIQMRCFVCDLAKKNDKGANHASSAGSGVITTLLRRTLGVVKYDEEEEDARLTN